VESLFHLLDLEEQFNKIVLPITKENPLLWKESVSFENFKRSASIVMSRGFHAEEGNGPFLVPIADMFNHSSISSKRCTSLYFEDGKFKMKAERFIKKGEEVFNTYGDLSSAQLLHTYGFVEPNNPFDSVLIDQRIVIDVCIDLEEGEEKELLEKRKDFLQSNLKIT